MRLGVSLDSKSDDPQEIARAYAEAGYGAAACPPVSIDQPERIQDIRQAFARQDVILAEIGAWNNLLDPDPSRREANLQVNIEKLALGDELGVRCCVNIAGSLNPDHWDGPHPRNLSADTFEQIVENVRRIIDTVRPKQTFYCLETMPWAIPENPQRYLELIRAIDRPMFGVHLDPVNLVNSPEKYFDNAALLRECFAKLGPWIVSCHAKDIRMQDRLTLHLDEVRPGLGALDYGVFLSELSRLPGDVPLIIEHLPQEEYPLAQKYIKEVAAAHGLRFNP